LQALWNFAYIESNRAILAAGIAKLEQLFKKTDDPILKKHIEGVLYMCNNPSTKSSSAASNGTTVDVANKGHIMISYNWGNQPIVKRIAASLKERGYLVWLDLEQMTGSTLEAMATAVEQSDLVLMCMSQKYKDSPNCRLEGEYCMNRRVAFCPLMMQEGYKPDGWLGITLGAKLWYDFTNENDWESKLSELVKAIGNRGKGLSPQSPLTPTKVDHTLHSPKKLINNWTFDDVLQWMKTEHIDHHFKLFKKHNMDGMALRELKRLLSHNPTFFLKFFSTLGIVGHGEMLHLSGAIHRL